MSNSKFVSGVRSMLVAVAGIGLVITILLTVADVVMRYLFNNPLFGAAEITQVLLSVTVFVGFCLVALDRTHIRVTLFETAIAQRFPEFWSRTYDLFVITGSLAVAGILIWRLMDLLEFPEDTLVLHLPMTAIVGVLIILACATVIAACVAAFGHNRNKAPGAEAGEF